jgi:hypothetical protein
VLHGSKFRAGCGTAELCCAGTPAQLFSAQTEPLVSDAILRRSGKKKDVQKKKNVFKKPSLKMINSPRKSTFFFFAATVEESLQSLRLSFRSAFRLAGRFSGQTYEKAYVQNAAGVGVYSRQMCDNMYLS